MAEVRIPLMIQDPVTARYEGLARETEGYYGRFQPMALGFSRPEARGKPFLTEVTPPPGVDAGSFYNLVRKRRGYAENLLAIDKAKNNTSVVFCLKWRGWQLLFAGDAEERSWTEMNKSGRQVLKPIHFLKVSHHGSYNGTPRTALLDRILPVEPHDNRHRSVLVSTYENTYNNVPDDDTLERLRRRCEEFQLLHKEAEPGSFVDILFHAP